MKIKPAKGEFRFALGDRGEVIAAAYLIDQGYEILEKKARTTYGEIDIVAREKDRLVFIEVKTRSSNQMGLPQEAVDIHKQKQMTRLASAYLKKNAFSKMKARFDVIALLYDGINMPQISHIRNAFEAQAG